MDKSNAIPLIGNKHFYTSDYQVHRRRINWTSTIKITINSNSYQLNVLMVKIKKVNILAKVSLNIYTT